MHVVRRACERPDTLGRSLSPWDGEALARQRISAGLVEDLSAAPVRRILAAPQRKPWRQHVWLYPKPPRDAAFDATVFELIDLYTQPRHPAALVRSVDEKPSLPPRPRRSPTRPAQPQHLPNRHEHEDKRAGALHRLAALDTRAGQVDGQCYERTRPQECIAFLAHGDQAIPDAMTTIPLVCDHVSTHHGQDVSKWVVNHPRFVVHCTPVHGSWMNQGEPWCSLLQRKRLRMVDFEAKDHLRQKLEPFSREWNVPAHPFNWSRKSVAKVMAAAPAMAAS
jgi:hypothetical protein